MILEKVFVEVNPLTTAHLTNAGFLFYSFPRTDTLPLHHHRIKAALAATAPEFLLAVKPIFPDRKRKEQKISSSSSKVATRTQVIMLRSAEADVSKLTQLLRSISNHPDFTFHPWREFMSLVPDKRRTIVAQQERFIQNHKILMIHDINTLAQDTMMHSYESADISMVPEEPKPFVDGIDLDKTTVTEFIISHYKAGDGTKLFQFAYPPVNGTIEILVQRTNLIEARECVDTIHTDLQYYSNERTRKLVFDETLLSPSQLQGYYPRTPYNTYNSIGMTPIDEEI